MRFFTPIFGSCYVARAHKMRALARAGKTGFPARAERQKRGLARAKIGLIYGKCCRHKERRKSSARSARKTYPPRLRAEFFWSGKELKSMSASIYRERE